MSTATEEPGTIATLPSPLETKPDTDFEEAFRSILDNEEKTGDNEDDTGDHERMSHYVKKDDIVRSSMTGKPVRALCGKLWTPRKNPEGFPVCPECKAEYDKRPAE